MRMAGWIFGIGVIGMGAIGLFTIALNMLSTPDTLTALGGAMILLAMAAVGGAGIWNLMERIAEAREQQGNGNGNGATVAVLLLALASAGCYTVVEPGYEGIKVHMVGSDRGVDYEHPIVTGRVFYNPVTYNIYKFPTFVQRVIWRAPEIVDGEADGSADESITFRSLEAYPFNVDVGFGYRFIPGQTPALFEKYRTTPARITVGPFRDRVREAFVEVGSNMEGLSILGDGVTALNEGVTAHVREALQNEINVEYVNIVGQPRVDPRVEASINMVIEETQAANAAGERVRRIEFEAQQRIEEANGLAEAIRIEAQAKAEAIEIEAQALREYGGEILQMRSIEKWDGVMPQVVAGGDGAVPFISIPRGAAR